MKNLNTQLKISLSNKLHRNIKIKAEELGISMADYVRTLVINDLRLEEDDNRVLNTQNRQDCQTQAPAPQVIVVNTDSNGQKSVHQEVSRENKRVKKSLWGNKKDLNLDLEAVLEMM